MADEHDKKPAAKPSMFGVWEPVVLIVGIIVALFAIAWYRGNLKNINTQGILQAPLPPVGSGNTYNPANAPIPGVQGVGSTTLTSTTTTSANQ